MKPFRRIRTQEHFFALVTEQENGCWTWNGSIDDHGYGKLYWHGQQVGAHRLAYKFAHPREDISGKDILHSCDTPSCVNPAHLWSGTQADNTADMIAKGRDRFGGNRCYR